MRVFVSILMVGATFLLASPHGGFYHYCNGQKWSSAPVAGKYLGKSCIHCRDGSEVKLYVKQFYNGNYNYYLTNMQYVGNNRDGGEVIINRVCR